MKTSLIKKTATLLALPLVTLAAWVGVASAAVPANGPYFNIHKNVNGVGDESDFLRIRKTDGTKVNTLEACDGELSLWFYVHNGQSAENNGDNLDGPGVAKNTRLSIRPLPTTFGKSHTLTGKITADNADTVTDTATITCGSSNVKVEYQAIEQVYRYNPSATTGMTLSGDITSSQGALLGMSGGKLPGCWDYRVIVLVKVKITKQPPVEEPVVKKCVPGEVVFVDRTKRDVKVSANVQNASVTKYVVTVKDGSGKVVDTKETATSATKYTYRFDQPAGQYSVSIKVVTNKGDADNLCNFTIKVDEEKVAYYRCEMFVLSLNGRKATASFKPVFGNGASFNNASVNFNNSNDSVIETDKLNGEGKVVVDYTYPGSDDLNKEVVATVNFKVGNETKSVVCKGKAEVKGTSTTNKNTPTPTPTQHYVTGPADMLAVAMITAIGATVAHRKYTLVKNGR